MIGRSSPPPTSNEQFRLISTFSSGRATSQGSGRRSQLSGCSRCQPCSMDCRNIPYSYRSPYPMAGVRFLLQEAEPVEGLLPDGVARDGTEQEIRDVVRQRSADEELHREVIDAFGVLARVRLLGADPSLREDVPDGTRDGLIALARTSRVGIGDVVEEQVPLVERIGGASQLDPAAVLPPQRLGIVGGRRCSKDGGLSRAHVVSRLRACCL